MAIANEEPKRMSEYTLVDCDVHCGRALSDDPKLERKKARLMSDRYTKYFDPDTEKRDSPHPYDGFPRAFGGRRQDTSSVVDGTTLNAPDLVKRELCDEFGVDYPVLNSAMSGLNIVQDPERAVEEMRANNDMFLDQFMDSYDNFRGLITVMLREPDKAAEEVDRLADEDQIVGVLMSDPAGQPWIPEGDPEYDVFFEAVEDNDLSVVYHSTSSMAVAPEFPIATWKTRYWVEQHSLVHPMSHMRALTSLIAQGVPEKFPDVTHVILEGGIGWVPAMISRLNRYYEQYEEEMPLLQKSPEEYIRESFYFGTQPLCEPIDKSHVHRLLEVVGADSLVFATDFPHFDFDNTETIHQTMKSVFSEEELEKVFHKNAANAFDLAI
jgi:predicted TIM-barrel fold metal-dependent hydrolase